MNISLQSILSDFLVSFSSCLQLLGASPQKQNSTRPEPGSCRDLCIPQIYSLLHHSRILITSTSGSSDKMRNKLVVKLAEEQVRMKHQLLMGSRQDAQCESAGLAHTAINNNHFSSMSRTLLWQVTKVRTDLRTDFRPHPVDYRSNQSRDCQSLL